MNNINNLKMIQSTEEAREKGRKGGIASGISRNKKKTFKLALQLLLEMEDKKQKISNLEVIAAKMVEGAKNGDRKKAEFIRDTIGEKPIEQFIEESYEDYLKRVEGDEY